MNDRKYKYLQFLSKILIQLWPGCALYLRLFILGHKADFCKVKTLPKIFKHIYTYIYIEREREREREREYIYFTRKHFLQFSPTLPITTGGGLRGILKAGNRKSR